MKPATRAIPMLTVVDMDASLQFYGAVLGGQPAYRFPEAGDPMFVTLVFGSSQLAIARIAGTPLHGRALRPAAGHRIELCINVENVDEAVAALSAIGALTVMPPADLPWGERSAYVEDPDGNLVMLVSPAQ